MRSLHAARAAAVAVLVVLASLLIPLATPAGASTNDEAEFVSRLNDLRAARGLSRLVVDDRLVAVARAWSAQMAATNTLKHNPDLTTQAPAEWQRLGENVGYGSSVVSIHDALVASPGHFANLVGSFNVVGIGVVRSGSTIWVTQMFMQGNPPVVTAASASAGAAGGYRLVSSLGRTFAYGVANDASASGWIVGGAGVPGKGHWLVGIDGAVHARGGAPYHGGLNNRPLSAPIVGMAATPSGNGYWLLGRDGGVFAFGDAGFFGSTGNMRLNQPVVAMASTPTGNGYWFVAADGGIFAFGDAKFFGSTGHIRLNQPVVGMAAAPNGEGYWLVARDGGVFAFGSAPFHGSAGHLRLNAPIVGMAPTATGNGYRFVASDGGIFAFGDASFLGSTAGQSVGAPIVAVLPA